MEEIVIFLQTLPEAIKMGLIYSIMVMGVFITFKILDFPDMSVDGTFPLGSFVFAAFALSENGFFGITHPIMGLIISLIAGMIVGFFTGFIHIYLNVNNLLSGILVMTALYSVNSRILGLPNVFISNDKSILEIINYENSFIKILFIFIILLILKAYYDFLVKENKFVIMSQIIYFIILIFLTTYTYVSKDLSLMLVSLIVFIVKMMCDYFLASKLGFVLKALGENEQIVSSLGVNEKKLKIFGLMISNSLVSLSGALFAQSIKVADLQSGLGTLVIGLAAIILGQGILKKSKIIKDLSIVIIGSIFYYIIINIALNSNSLLMNLYKTLNLNENLISKLMIKPTDVKIITSIILAFIFWRTKRKGLKK